MTKSQLNKSNKLNKTNEEEKINNPTVESIFYEFLVKINSLIIKSKNSLSVHSQNSDNNLDLSIYLTSKEKIDKQINKIVNKLTGINGINENHKITALTQISNHLIDELNTANLPIMSLPSYQSVNLSKVRADAADNQKQSTNLTNQLAEKEMKINKLIKEKESQIDERKQLDILNQSLRYELEKSIVEHSKISQTLVELRLRCLDYKNVVDQYINQIERKITSQLGYLPIAIDKELSSLKLIKAPSHKDYDISRITSMIDTKAISNFNISNSFRIDTDKSINLTKMKDSSIDSKLGSTLDDSFYNKIVTKIDDKVDAKIINKFGDHIEDRMDKHILARMNSPIKSNKWIETIMTADRQLAFEI